jgi:hypothetical protein
MVPGLGRDSSKPQYSTTITLHTHGGAGPLAHVRCLSLPTLSCCTAAKAIQGPALNNTSSTVLPSTPDHWIHFPSRPREFPPDFRNTISSTRNNTIVEPLTIPCQLIRQRTSTNPSKSGRQPSCFSPYRTPCELPSS